MIVILMGVSGAGKTTVGRRLAEELGWDFVDGDDLHPVGNRRKMASGLPLDDEDRWPWLDRIHQTMVTIETVGGSAVVACSALRDSYRKRLVTGLPSVRYFLLDGDPSVIRSRLEARTGHFFAAAMLDSQLDTFEHPDDALRIDVDQAVERQVAGIIAALGLGDG